MKHTLIKGDCLEVMDKLIEQGVKVDLILTDPPYGVTSCGWDSIIPFDKMWERINNLINDNQAILLYANEPFSTYLRMSNIKNYKYDWYWNKENGGIFSVAKYKPLSIIEQVIVFGKDNEKLNYYPIMEEAKKENMRNRKQSKIKEGNLQELTSGVYKPSENHEENKRYPKNLLTYSNRGAELHATKRLHPTQKPIKMLEYLINTYTLEGATVLDFTCGSNSTGITCLNTNRNYIGIEKDDTYFNVSVDRTRKHIEDNNIDVDLIIKQTLTQKG